MSYSSNVKNILGQVKTKLKEIADFGNRVYYGLRKKHGKYPTVLIHLVTDESTTATLSQEEHVFTLRILLKVRGDLNADSEDQMDMFIDEAGKVHDKLGEVTYNKPYWQNLLVSSINYTFHQASQAVYYDALFVVKIEEMF